jgi:hypothetical protein
MAALPRDRHGRVVPWFVAFIDGQPDHRIIRPGGVHAAVLLSTCWLCGQQMSAYKAFVIGPMCAINRVSAEPPSHRDCAEYSARACPFLTRPNMRRRDSGMPESTVNPAGVMIARNPGVTPVWTTKRHDVEQYRDGFLFRIGDPKHVEWLAEGRLATRWEIDQSIDSGLPILQAEAEAEGPRAVAALERMVARARTLLPAEPAVTS